MRLVSILLPSRKDPRRRNLDPEEDKCRIQFPERNRLLNLLLIHIVECSRRRNIHYLSIFYVKSTLV